MANYSAFFTWIRQWYLFNTKNNLMWKCATSKRTRRKTRETQKFSATKMLKKQNIQHIN